MLHILFDNIKKKVEEKDIKISLTQSAKEYIAKIGFDPVYGARPLKRLINKEVVNELSKMILADKIQKDKPVIADIFNGNIVFRNE